MSRQPEPALMRRVVAFLVVSTVLAGCASEAPEPQSDDSLGGDVQVEVSDTTGAIRGVVVDDAVRPLAGVHVRLLQASRHANTTDDGTFSFSNLEPGTYFLEASRFGYSSVQQSTQVVAGDDQPPIVRVQLIRDPDQRAYVNAQSTTGFILCSTSLVLLCAAPDLVNELIVCGVFNVCLGPLTPDRSGFYLYYEPNATMIQAEMVWDSTQPLSPELTMSMENIEGCEAESDSYVEGVSGTSPIHNIANASDIAEGTIGGTCGIWYSFFSGDVGGVPAGATLQQQVQVFSHEFHGYTPADMGKPDWRLTNDGEPPAPPE